MSVSSFRQLAADAGARLAAAGVEGARREAWLLLELAVGRSRAQLVAHADEVPDRSALETFERVVARRLAREPLAYIRGEKEFWSLTLQVRPGVLVPRPESETVVDAVLEHLPRRSAPLRLLDLGTGTGCLLLALLSELPNAQGVGVDLAPAAVACACANASRLGLAGRALIVRGAWASALAGPFDLIVSNPPYVRASEWPELAPEIRRHEPAGALLAGPDGLDGYRALAPDLTRLLAERGFACLEHGYDQTDGMRQIMAGSGLHVEETRNDLAGRPRATVVTK